MTQVSAFDYGRELAEAWMKAKLVADHDNAARSFHSFYQRIYALHGVGKWLLDKKVASCVYARECGANMHAARVAEECDIRSVCEGRVQI